MEAIKEGSTESSKLAASNTIDDNDIIISNWFILQLYTACATSTQCHLSALECCDLSVSLQLTQCM
jgi:hypothetical protein